MRIGAGCSILYPLAKLADKIGMNPTQLLSKLGISASLSQDIILLFVVVFISFVFGMFIGRQKLLSVLINIYISFAVVNVIPPNYFTDPSYRSLVFLIIVIGLTLLGGRMFDIYLSGAGSGFIWRVFAVSFLEVTLLLSILISLLPKKEALSYVSASSYGYLASDPMKFIWMIAPLVFMFFIHKRINR